MAALAEDARTDELLTGASSKALARTTQGLVSSLVGRADVTICAIIRAMASRIHMPEEALAAFCRKHRVRKLALFGSVLRDDFRPDSDVDVLVEFEPGARAGFLKLAAMELELGSMIGRKIDLRTPGELSRYFRDEVLASAEVQFAT